MLKRRFTVIIPAIFAALISQMSCALTDDRQRGQASQLDSGMVPAGIQEYMDIGRALGDQDINYGEIYWGNQVESIRDFMEESRSDLRLQESVADLLANPDIVAAERDASLLIFLAANILPGDMQDFSLFVLSSNELHRFQSYYAIHHNGLGKRHLSPLLSRLGSLLSVDPSNFSEFEFREFLFVLRALASDKETYAIAQGVATVYKDDLVAFFNANSWETILDPHHFYD